MLGSALPMPLQGLPGRNGASGQQGFPGPRVSPGESWGPGSYLPGEDPQHIHKSTGGAHVVHQPGGSPRSEVPPQEGPAPHHTTPVTRVLAVSVTGQVAHIVRGLGVTVL